MHNKFVTNIETPQIIEGSKPIHTIIDRGEIV